MTAVEMEKPEYDVVVIGAGPTGIVAARFYMDVHPNCKLAILEEDTVVGGVWSSTRQYKGFWSQSGLRMAGFSDTPIKLPEGAEMYHDAFEAKHVTRYLEEYVDNHVYDSRSLRDRTIFGFKVQGLEKVGGVWNVDGGDGASRIIRTRKLIVASGHTSIPHLPALPNQSTFQGSIVHQKDFGQLSKTAFASSSPHTDIAVLGGGKSAADMVYDSVKAGRKVSWIIRQTGEGPAAFTAAAGRGQYKSGAEMAATRFFPGLSPSCFAPKSWWTRAIHKSSLGQDITTKIWKGADNACIDLANFEAREGALPGFENLRPSTDIFWCTGPFGMIQHDDFWDTIAKNVHAYRSNVKTLESNAIVLEDGSKVPADILFCGTGWNQHYPFLTKEQVVELGLSHSSEDDPEDVRSMWASLMKTADQKVLSDFPKLKTPPEHDSDSRSITPSRLYNGIAPLNDDSIVFVGHVILSNAFRLAEAQAIWVTAYFDGKIERPSKDIALQEVAYNNAFSRRRYPTHGATGNDFHLDLIGYTDKLMEDVGLVSHKQKGWWANFVDPCLASDYKDMKREYLEKHGAKDSSDGDPKRS